MSPAAASTTSKSQRTYDWIRERVLRRDFNPGYRLVLSSIAAELGVSAVPVREAIRRLEAEGLVEFEPNVGARVAMINETEYADTMQSLGVLEGAATVLSLPYVTTGDIAAAQALNDQMRVMLEDFDPGVFTALNEKFHRALYSRCPNKHMTTMADNDWSRMSRLRTSTFSFVPDRAPRSVDEHDHILELIRSQADPTTIEMAIRHHKWRTLDRFRAQGF